MKSLRFFLVPVLLSALFVHSPATAAFSSRSDAALKEGWKLLQSDKYRMALDKFGKIPVREYELGDYVLYFSGLSLVRDGNRAAAAAVLDNLSSQFSRSPLIPYLALELAVSAAREDNLALAAPWFAVARGKVAGGERKSEEGYVAARLKEANDPAGAADAHLRNFSGYTAQEGAFLSLERLRLWRREGKLAEWDMPLSFYGTFARALYRGSLVDEAKDVYREALRRFPPGEDYYTVLLDFAELLRKQGDTEASRALLDQAMGGAPPSFCSEVAFLRARVDWKAGRLDDARKTFVDIAKGNCKPGTYERAMYLAAWIAEEEGDLPWLTEAFGNLRNAADDAIRQESTFRHAYGLFRQQRYAEAEQAFADGEKKGFSTVEKARYAYWRAESLLALDRKGEAEGIFRRLAGDPGSGIYALFAVRKQGGDPYAMLEAPSSMETASCGDERERLWEKVRKAQWPKEEAARIRRAERLTRLDMIEYAILEAGQMDRAGLRKALGVEEGGTAGLFRYLAGDLRGALREADRLPTDLTKVGNLERIQFPLAPHLVGDCDRKRSGIDPLVLHSVIRQESQFSANILSPAGAVGLMQLMPRTAAEVARKERKHRPRRKDLVNPLYNVDLGAKYLSRLVRTFDGDYMRAVAAYNGGETAVGKWWRNAGEDPARFLEAISYKETRFYVRRVFFNLLQYYRIYRPQMYARYFPSVPPADVPAPGVAETPPTGASAEEVPVPTVSPAAP